MEDFGGINSKDMLSSVVCKVHLPLFGSYDELVMLRLSLFLSLCHSNLR